MLQAARYPIPRSWERARAKVWSPEEADSAGTNMEVEGTAGVPDHPSAPAWGTRSLSTGIRRAARMAQLTKARLLREGIAIRQVTQWEPQLRESRV